MFDFLDRNAVILGKTSFGFWMASLVLAICGNAPFLGNTARLTLATLIVYSFFISSALFIGFIIAWLHLEWVNLMDHFKR